MKIFRLVIYVILIIGFQNTLHANGPYVGIAVGAGDIDIDSDTFPGLSNEFTESNRVAVGDLLIGYQYESGLFIDLGLEGYETVDLFGLGEAVDLSSVRAGIGYVFPSGSSFKLFAKTGLSFWNLELTESPLFNPGPEDVGKRSGEDIFLQIGVDYYFTESFRLGLSYDITSPSFGEATAGKLQLKYAF